MMGVRISELTEGTGANGADIIEIEQGGQSKKLTIARATGLIAPGEAASAPYTVLATDTAVKVTFSSGAVNLPEATGFGRRLRIIKTNETPGSVTVTPDGSDTIQGNTSVVIYAQYDYVELLDFASGVWVMVDHKIAGTTTTDTDYTVQPLDETIYANFETGTINLPEATGSGRKIKIIKIHATQNDITITPDGTDTIEGRSDDLLKAQYSYMILQDIVSGVWKQIEVRDVGTWTPYLIIGAADPSDATYNTQNGTYLRDDKLVTLTISLTLSNKGTDTGSIKLGGIPYNNATGTIQYTGTIAKQNCNHGSGVIILQITSTDNDMFFFRVVPDGSGTLGYIIDTDIANTFSLHGTVTYRFI